MIVNVKMGSSYRMGLLLSLSMMLNQLKDNEFTVGFVEIGVYKLYREGKLSRKVVVDFLCRINGQKAKQIEDYLDKVDERLKTKRGLK